MPHLLRATGFRCAGFVLALLLSPLGVLGAVEDGWVRPGTADGPWLWPQRAVDAGPWCWATCAVDWSPWTGGGWLTASMAHPVAADHVALLGRYGNCRRLVVQVADAAGDWQTVYDRRPPRRAWRYQVVPFSRRVVSGVRVRVRYRWWHGIARLYDLQLYRRDRPPEVELTAPAAGAEYVVGQSVPIAAEVSDPDPEDEPVGPVHFTVDGTPLTTDAAAPFATDWTAAGAGAHTIAATVPGGYQDTVTITVIPLSGQYVGPFRWARKLFNPAYPLLSAVARDETVETVTVRGGAGPDAGVLDTLQWSGDNQEGGRSWSANTLVGNPGTNYWVGMESWAIRESLGDPSCADHLTHRHMQDAHLRLGFVDAEAIDLDVTHGTGFGLDSPVPADALVVELSFRNWMGGGARWQMGYNRGNPLQVGVWQVAAGTTLQAAQQDTANRLCQLEVLAETSPRDPVMAKLQVQPGGHWQVFLDLDADAQIDVSAADVDPGNAPCAFGALDQGSGLLVTTAPAGGVHAGKVGHTDIALAYRADPATTTGAYARRPLWADIPTSSPTSPVRFTGKRWAAGYAVSAAPGAIDQVGQRLFHATVPLAPADVTEVTLSQIAEPPPAGVPTAEATTTRTGAITWTAIDLYQGHAPVTVRAGDSLLFTVESGSGGDTTPVTIDIDGDGVPECSGLPGERLPCPFPEPDTYEVQALYGGAAAIDGVPIAPLIVHAVAFRLPDPVACEIGYARDLDVDLGACDPATVVLQAADAAVLEVSTVATVGRTRRIALRPTCPGTPVLEARGPGGVLLDAVEVDEFDFRDDNAAVIPVVATYPDGSMLVEATIVQDPQVPYLDCRFEIFVSHLAFDDGTLIKHVPTADFTPRPGGGATYPLRMLMSPDCSAGACHTQTVYQDGVRVSR